MLGVSAKMGKTQPELLSVHMLEDPKMYTAAERLDAHQLQEGFHFHELVPLRENQQPRRQRTAGSVREK